MKLPIFLAFVVVVATSQTVDYDAKGRAEFAAGQYRAAKTSFEQAASLLESQPNGQAIVLTNLGMTLVALGEQTLAERALRKATALKPESARSWQYLAQAVLQKGDKREAERLLQKALGIVGSENRVEASCLSDLATILIQTKRKPEATEILGKAIAIAGDGQARARMLRNLGVLKWDLGKLEEAEELLGRAMAEMEAVVGKEHPDVAQILDDYAMVLQKRGRKLDARKTAARAESLRQAFGWQANTGKSAVDWRDIR